MQRSTRCWTRMRGTEMQPGTNAMQYPYATFFDAEGEDFVPEQYRAWKAVNDQCLQMIAQGIDSPELDALSIQEKHLREVAEEAYDEYVRVHFKRHSP